MGRLLSNISGNNYGNLVVLSYSHSIPQTCGGTRVYWLCQCVCGNTIKVRTSNLKSGRVRSCGCINEPYVASDVKKYFETYYNSISEYKVFKNPQTNRYLPYDIYIPDKKVFIEIHGDQHYRFRTLWYKDYDEFLYRQELDKLKKKYAKKNGNYIEVDLRKIKTSQEAINYIENIINS